MKQVELLNTIDTLKAQLDELRRIPKDRMNRIMQKLRLDWDYHSNSIEGNTLSKAETRALIYYGLTAKGKPLRDHKEMKGHHEALHKLEEVVSEDRPITENLIKEFHRMVLVEPGAQDEEAEINPGEYKTRPNYTYSPEGERIDFDPPGKVPEKMNELINWTRNQLDPPKRKKQKYDLHPLITACIFHLRFIRIHPFGDGNGRVGRILMNLILMQQGYFPAIIRLDKKQEYYRALNQSTEEEPEPLVEYVGEELKRSLEIAIQGAKGESIREEEDLDKEVDVLKRMQNPDERPIERSLEVMKRVFDKAYLPFLKEMEYILRKFDNLFEENEWRYFPDERSPYYQGMETPVQDRFLSIINHINRIIEFDVTNPHHYKAIKIYMNYNNAEPFDLEVVSILNFEEHGFKIDLFVGERYGSTVALQFIKEISDSLREISQKEKRTDKLKTITLVEKDYREEVFDEEIKEWGKEVGEEVLKMIKKRALNKKE